jgi:hypothetical protein
VTLLRKVDRQLAFELELDTRLAARALARARVRKEREPVKAIARQIRDELGLPALPVLEAGRK